jgi:pimeloyl-ACP methyl ester carboxylesterase
MLLISGDRSLNTTTRTGLCGEPVAPFLPAAIRRADPRFRQRLFAAARAGDGPDQRLAVEASEVPLAVVNGAADPLVKLDYLDSIAYRNLWHGRCYRLPHVGHAPFWRAPTTFNALLDRFLGDMEKR